MGLVPEEEEKRYFIQLALEGGEEFLSSKTRYVHDEEMIPLYENFCYVLALASSRHKENAEKAKELLLRVLHFQIPSSPNKGAFPKYLHQYPYPKDLRFQKDVLWILTELLEHHALALGKEVLTQVARAAEELKNYLKAQDIQEMEDIRDNISSTRLSYALVPGKGAQETYDRWSIYWNPSLMCYTGPCFEEYYERGEIKRCTWDYLMSSYYHVYPSFLKTKQLLKLQGALIPYFPHRGEFTYGELQGVYRDMPWAVWNSAHDSLFLFRSFFPQPPQDKGLHVFRYVWKGEHTLHHLVCQSIHQELYATHVENETALIFTYPETMETDEHNPLELFVQHHPALAWSVGSQRATLFYLEDKVVLYSYGAVLEFVFSIEEGEGDVLGHLSRGNRPSQIVSPKEDYEAFDWRLFVRILRRTSTFKLKLQMTRKAAFSYAQIQDCLEKLPLHATHCPHTESPQ